MLLLTIIRSIRQNIWTTVPTYGLNGMRSIQKFGSEYFPYGTNNWSIRSLLYSNHEVVGKFLEGCRKIIVKLMKSMVAQFCENQTKNITTRAWLPYLHFVSWSFVALCCFSLLVLALLLKSLMSRVQTQNWMKFFKNS